MQPIAHADALKQRFIEVRELAVRLIALHGLCDWQFLFNRRKTSMGICYYRQKVIALSGFFVALNNDVEIRDTILHEIAHALVGLGHGHDGIWKAKCLEIGARPERTCKVAAMPMGRWRATCGGCGKMHHRHRRPRPAHGWFCRRCGGEKGRLVWGNFS